jgi:NHLM bacteriocin system ABC transporter ATP-binding protein
MEAPLIPSSIEQLFLEKGKTLSIEMSYRLLLHDVDSLFLVHSGDLDIFALQPKEKETFSDQILKKMSCENNFFLGDLIEGPLIFLCHISPGQLIFPFALGSTSHSFKMIAKANTSVVLHKLSFREIDEIVFKNEELKTAFMALLKLWIETIFEPLHIVQPHHVTHYLEDEKRWQLNPKDTISLAKHNIGIEDKSVIPRVKVLEGCLIPVSFESIRLTSEGNHTYPLIAKMWLESIESSEIDVLIQTGWDKGEICRSDLLYFQETILQAVAQNAHYHALEDKEEMLSKETRDREFLQDSFKKMGSVLSAEKTIDIISSYDQLFKVCRIVANIIHENLVEPPTSIAKTADERLYEISIASRIHYRKVILSDNWWTMDSGPLVGFWKKDLTPVALIPYASGHYQVVDSSGEVVVPKVNEKVSQELEPTGAMFYRSLPPKKQLTGKDVVKFCLTGRMSEILTIIGAGCLGTLISLFIPFANAILFDEIIPTTDTTLLIQLVIGLVVASISFAIFILIREYAQLRLENFVDHDLEAALWMRMLDLPASFFRKFTVGDLIQRLSTVSIIRKALSGYFLRLILNAIFSFIYLIAMFYYSVILSVVSLIIVSMSLVASAIYFAFGLGIERRSQDMKGIINGKIVQIILGLSKIRSNGMENRIFASWAQSVAGQKQLDLLLSNMKNLVKTVNSIIPAIAYLAIFYVIFILESPKTLALGGYFISLGSFFAFISAFSSFSYGIIDASNILIEIINIFPSWKRAKVVLQTAPESDPERVKLGILKGEVQVDHIYFRYEESSPYVLQDISLYIAPGEFVGIVGPTGCGKSSLIRLLLGFETLEQGAIYYDGKDLASLNLRDLRSQLGVVMQNSSILDGSIRDNITGGSLATDDQVMAAVRLAGLDEDIKQLPMGIRTVLTNGGVTLSGGQKQRVLIARALFKQAKLVILDEATNALDNKTQEVISNNLDHLEITRIVVAHRLSTIRNADKIYVIQEGKIIDSGTFTELASKPGFFTRLLAQQHL